MILSVLAGLLAITAISAGGPPGTPPGLARAIAAQEAHTDALLATPGVVGTAVGLGANGAAVVLVLTEEPGVAGIPTELDGVKVVGKVTGRIFALCHKGGPDSKGCGGGGPGIAVNPTSGLETTEAGGTATFTVVLDTQPTADVTIGLSSDDTTEGTVSPTSLIFTNANWDTPQLVTVTGEDDTAEDGDIVYDDAHTALAIGARLCSAAHYLAEDEILACLKQVPVGFQHLEREPFHLVQAQPWVYVCGVQAAVETPKVRSASYSATFDLACPSVKSAAAWL